MSKRPAAFWIVALAALVAAAGQVTLGGVVRVTDSGLGCPDWPLCHGQLLPPLELNTLIEYSHRLTATLLGALVLAATVLGWRTARGDLRVTVSSTLALALVLLAAVLGGITVWIELAWWVVLLHLAIAEMVVACLVVASLAGWDVRGSEQIAQPVQPGPGWLGLLLVSAAAGVFALVLSGSYVVGQGYGSACATWPLCRGSVLPEGVPSMVHMSHRIAAALVGLLVMAAATAAWSNRARLPGLRWPSLAVMALLVTQVLIGAATVWTGFSAPIKTMHLTTATLLWGSLVLLAVLYFLPRPVALRDVARGPRWVRAVERMAP